jgi:hypothetical protein
VSPGSVVVVVVVVRKSTHTIPYRLCESTAYHKGGVVAKEPPGHMDTHIGETRTPWTYARTAGSSTGWKLASLKRRHAGPPHSRCGVLHTLRRYSLPCSMLNHGVRHARSRSTRHRAISTPRPRSQAEPVRCSHPCHSVAQASHWHRSCRRVPRPAEASSRAW